MNSYRAELLRSANRATAAFLAVCVLGVLFIMLSNATASPGDPMSGFQQGSILAGSLLMCRAATFAAHDFSSGTVRAWLISAPSRGSVFLGRIAAAVTVAVGVSVVTGILGYAFSAIVGAAPAPADMAVATGRFIFAGVVLTIFGHAVGILTRSVPVSLVVTLGWVLPVEKGLGGRLPGLAPWLPAGLVQDINIGQLPAGSTMAGAFAHATVPFVLLDAIALAVFLRRDITN